MAGNYSKLILFVRLRPCCYKMVARFVRSLMNTVRVAECYKHRCFNPVAAATAFDNNASVVVTFTNPPTSFSYAEYAVCLIQQSSVINVTNVMLKVSLIVGTCKASRFDPNSNQPSDWIRFESDWPIQNFSNRIGRSCSFARRKLSQTTQTINGA